MMRCHYGTFSDDNMNNEHVTFCFNVPTPTLLLITIACQAILSSRVLKEKKNFTYLDGTVLSVHSCSSLPFNKTEYVGEKTDETKLLFKTNIVVLL